MARKEEKNHWELKCKNMFDISIKMTRQKKKKMTRQNTWLYPHDSPTQ